MLLGFYFFLNHLATFLSILLDFQAKLKSPAASLTLVADVLARIANTGKGLALFLHEKNVVIAHSER